MVFIGHIYHDTIETRLKRAENSGTNNGKRNVSVSVGNDIRYALYGSLVVLYDL